MLLKTYCSSVKSQVSIQMTAGKETGLRFPQECHRPKVSQRAFRLSCLMSALCSMSFHSCLALSSCLWRCMDNWFAKLLAFHPRGKWGLARRLLWILWCVPMIIVIMITNMSLDCLKWPDFCFCVHQCVVKADICEKQTLVHLSAKPSWG